MAIPNLDVASAAIVFTTEDAFDISMTRTSSAAIVLSDDAFGVIMAIKELTEQTKRLNESVARLK